MIRRTNCPPEFLGKRCRLNALGRQKKIWDFNREGIIVGEGYDRKRWQIKMEGRKNKVGILKQFVEIIE